MSGKRQYIKRFNGALKRTCTMHTRTPAWLFTVAGTVGKRETDGIIVLTTFCGGGVGEAVWRVCPHGLCVTPMPLALVSSL